MQTYSENHKSIIKENLHNLIKCQKESQIFTLPGEQEYFLIHRFEDPNNSQKYNYYFVDFRNILGNGANGDIILAQWLDPEAGLSGKKTQNDLVVKVSSNEDNNFARAEKSYLIMRKLFNTFPPVILGKLILLFMEQIQGKDLLQKADKANRKQLSTNRSELLTNEIKSMLLIHRLYLAFTLASNFHLLSSCKPNGPAVVHGDVKHANLMYQMCISEGEPNTIAILPIDFDASLILKSEEDLKSTVFRGNKNESAPEFIQYTRAKKLRNGTLDLDIPVGVIGIKSDIYQLAAIFSELLGTENPYKDFKEIWFYSKQAGVIYNLENIASNHATLLNFDGMLFDENKLLLTIFGDKKSALIENLAKTFINYMRKPYGERADNDEVLVFFASLFNLYLTANQLQKEDASLLPYLAKLIIVAHGLWKDSEFATAFAKHDFSETPKLCKKIVDLYMNEKCNVLSLKHILQEARLSSLRTPAQFASLFFKVNLGKLGKNLGYELPMRAW